MRSGRKKKGYEREEVVSSQTRDGWEPARGREHRKGGYQILHHFPLAIIEKQTCKIVYLT